jgi:hypothetical protein
MLAASASICHVSFTQLYSIPLTKLGQHSSESQIQEHEAQAGDI